MIYSFHWGPHKEFTIDCDPALWPADLNWRFKTILTKKYRTTANNVTGKVNPQSREVKSVVLSNVLLMIAQMLSFFDLKMTFKLTHGFIGNTCCFRIRIHCFAFSSKSLQMWVPPFFSSMFCGTLFVCSSVFCFLLFLFWGASSGFSCDVFLCHNLDFPFSEPGGSKIV